MKIKNRLHNAITLVVLSGLLLTGSTILIITRDSITRKLDRELSQTSFLIYQIVNNVFELNKKVLESNLRLLDSSVRSSGMIPVRLVDSDAEHYITRLTDYVQIPTLTINGEPAFGDTRLVDEVAAISGGNVSILQLFPMGLLRISTNIRRGDGTRATQVYFPEDSPICKAIRSGDTYIDKAFEMNEWYIVAYRPLRVDGEIVGALHVGIKPEITEMRKNILGIRVGATGSPYVVDTEGILVIAAESENENVYHLPHIKRMIEGPDEGKVLYSDGQGERGGAERIVYYKRLPEMGWIVASDAYVREFFGDLDLISAVIVVSVIIAFLASVLVSLKISENLTRPIKSLTESMNEIKAMEYDFSDFKKVDGIKSRIAGIRAQDEEIRVMAGTFHKMLDALEDDQRRLISKHRRYRESELAKKIHAELAADLLPLHGYEDSGALMHGERCAGRYFDRSPGPAGKTWYAVGEVLESGLPASMVMMMAQTAIASILRSIPDATELEVCDMVNAYLVDHIRKRLASDCFLSLSLVLTDADGRCRYLGAARSLLLYRRADGACILVPTQATEGRSRMATLRLEAGDALTLYPQQAAAAPDKEGHGGIEALMDTLRAHAAEEPELLVRKLSLALGPLHGQPGEEGSVFVLTKS